VKPEARRFCCLLLLLPAPNLSQHGSRICAVTFVQDQLVDNHYHEKPRDFGNILSTAPATANCYQSTLLSPKLCLMKKLHFTYYSWSNAENTPRRTRRQCTRVDYPKTARTYFVHFSGRQRSAISGRTFDSMLYYLIPPRSHKILLRCTFIDRSKSIVVVHDSISIVKYFPLMVSSLQ
jgi:hypothetical protein